MPLVKTRGTNKFIENVCTRLFNTFVTCVFCSIINLDSLKKDNPRDVNKFTNFHEKIYNDRSRLDHLTPSEQMILKIASVLPRFFTLQQLLFTVEYSRGDMQRGTEKKNAYTMENMLLENAYEIDYDSAIYMAVERLVFSIVLSCINGDMEYARRAMLETRRDPEIFVGATLQLPLHAEAVLTFHSSALRACTSKLLLSEQRSRIQNLVSTYIVPH